MLECAGRCLSHTPSAGLHFLLQVHESSSCTPHEPSIAAGETEKMIPATERLLGIGMVGYCACLLFVAIRNGYVPGSPMLGYRRHYRQKELWVYGETLFPRQHCLRWVFY